MIGKREERRGKLKRMDGKSEGEKAKEKDCRKMESEVCEAKWIKS